MIETNFEPVCLPLSNSLLIYYEYLSIKIVKIIVYDNSVSITNLPFKNIYSCEKYSLRDSILPYFFIKTCSNSHLPKYCLINWQCLPFPKNKTELRINVEHKTTYWQFKLQLCHLKLLPKLCQILNSILKSFLSTDESLAFYVEIYYARNDYHLVFFFKNITDMIFRKRWT